MIVYVLPRTPEGFNFSVAPGEAYSRTRGGERVCPRTPEGSNLYGKIFLKGTPQQFMVVFKDWIGKGNNFSGYLYTSAPLSASEKESGYIAIASLDVAIEKKFDENWYYVSFRLD